MNYELNNVRRDRYVGETIKYNSPIVEVFSAMINGKEMPKHLPEAKVNKAKEHIDELFALAAQNDPTALAELNTIRVQNVMPLLNEELKLLNQFGTFQALAFDETVEREITVFSTNARFQALNGDVPIAAMRKTKYPVATTTLSAGYMVDYRKAQMGDMSDELTLQNQIRTDLWNKALLYVVKTIYNSVKNGNGVKFFYESNGISKTALDALLTQLRKFGRVTIAGQYSAVSQLNGMVGWSDGNANFGVSQEALNEIRENGIVGLYNGCPVVELPAYIDYSNTETFTIEGNETGTTYANLMPEGILWLLPTIGGDSPVATYTRGGITTLTGVDVTTGHYVTRFDLEFAADVAKGYESTIGILNDTNLTADGALSL